MLRRAVVSVAVGLACSSGPVRAADLPCGPVEAGVIHLDGLLDDWDGVEGIDVGGHDPDLSFTVRCNYDDKALYLAFEVRDDYLVRTREAGPAEDHLELAFAAGERPRAGAHSIGGKGGGLDRLLIYPADPAARLKRIVRWASGRAARGVEVAEARLPEGWAVELRLALAAVPGYTEGAPLLKASVGVYDCDSKLHPAVEASLSTASMDSPETLGAIVFPESASSLDAFLRDRHLERADVRFDRVGKVAGGASGRAVVAGPWLAIIGDEYHYVSLPIGGGKDLLDARLVDLGGDGRDAVVLRYVERSPEGEREVLAAFRLSSEGLRRVFACEVGRSRGASALRAKVSFVKKGRATDLLVEALPAKGWTFATYHEPRADDLAPIPTPWDKPPRARFHFQGDVYFQSE